MYSNHWYAYCWLCIMLLHILWRRIFWINRLTLRVQIIISSLIRVPFLKQRSSVLFPQDVAFNLGFFILALLSNTLILFIFPGLSILDTVRNRLGILILVNMNALFLLSFRHSIYIELAAAYQPEFLWAHQALGSITIAQVAAHFGLEFRGMKSISHPEYPSLKLRGRRRYQTLADINGKITLRYTEKTSDFRKGHYCDGTPGT